MSFPVIELLEPRLLLSGSTTALSPALFVENDGQWSDPTVRYVHQGTNLSIAAADSGLLFEAFQSDVAAQFSASFVGANPTMPVGVDRAATTFNYLLDDSSDWRSNVASYNAIEYQGLWSGIDLVAEGLVSHMKYEFDVAAGADATQIAVRLDGISGLSIDSSGALNIDLGAWGRIVDDAPVLWQTTDGKRVDVAGSFRLLDANTYTIDVTGAYDHSAALVIDPNVDWVSYLGGSDWDFGQAIATDSTGNSYVAGYTRSNGWATSGAFKATLAGGFDAFVAKMDPTGANLLWATYLGGSDADYAYGIAVDGSGNAYVTGGTFSSGWATGGAYKTAFGGVEDAFVAKLNSTGSALTFMTYLGGSDVEIGYGIALDSSGNAYVTGYTLSSGWTTSGAYRTTLSGQDAFVAEVSSTGAGLLYATYFGGAGTDYGQAIALDGSNDAFITGYTNSTGITTGGVFQTAFGGGTNDAFAAKFNPTGTSLLFSTYFGGTGDDEATGIAVDSAGDSWVSGFTNSSGLGSTGAWQTSNAGGYDAFVAKFNPTGTARAWSTYLGGVNDDKALAIAVNSSGNAHVTGWTQSSGWATTGAYNATYSAGYDVFVAKLNAAGSTLLYNSYLGGAGGEWGTGIAVDASGLVHVTGWTTTSGWATAGAYDTVQAGAYDVFVAVLDITPPELTAIATMGFAPRGVSQTVGYVHGLISMTLTFNEAVNATLSGMLVQNVTFPGGVKTLGATVTPSGISGSGTNTITVTFTSDSVVNTWVLVTLYGSGATPVTDLGGNVLDGEPNAGGSGAGYVYTTADMPTGNGLPGGDAHFIVGDFVGDCTGDGTVNFPDVVVRNAAWLSQTGDSNYNAQADATGDGHVNFPDVVQFNAHWLQHLDSLPAGLSFAPVLQGALDTTVTPPASESLTLDAPVVQQGDLEGPAAAPAASAPVTVDLAAPAPLQVVTAAASTGVTTADSAAAATGTTVVIYAEPTLGADLSVGSVLDPLAGPAGSFLLG